MLTACSVNAAMDGAKVPLRCLLEAGEQWSQLRQTCLRLSAAADVRLDDSAYSGAAVYALFSPDRQQAELFANDIEGSLLLDAVKGGYRSRDGVHYLQYRDGNWHRRQKAP